MGLFSADIETMDDLSLHRLRDLCYAENQIVKALPDMIARATSDSLRQALESHLEETRGQIARPEPPLGLLGQEAGGTGCPAIGGIVEEADEISRCGTLVAWAQELDREDCARLLRQTLEEERPGDRKLTDLAGQHLNRAA